jgi:NDP-sugar pyrophosphorylase family protein
MEAGTRMRAFILCGGLGTRLRGVIGDTQKAVAEVSGRPFLAYVVDELASAGIDDLVFCTHFHSDQVEGALAALPPNKARRTLTVREPEPLGTGGAIINAIAASEHAGPLIALNADTFIESAGYATAARAKAPFLLVTPVEDCERYGAVKMDASGRVIQITEKGQKGPGLISAGVYGFSTEHLAGFPAGPLSMERDIIPTFISASRLHADRYEGAFLDIGTPESLQQIRTHGVKEIR